MKKIRADRLLFERGFFESTDQAARQIMAGKVRIHKDHVIAKPSELLFPDTTILLDESGKYVSRGAFKLLNALERRLPRLAGKTALDIGASTGGFTDVLLQHGIEKVYACDVGRGLLHGKIRNDPRVVVREGLHAKQLSTHEIPEKIDVLTADVSFISVTQVLPAADPLLQPGAWCFILVKPQFEAPKEDVPAGGIVADEAVRTAAVRKVISFAEQTLAWENIECRPCPLKGTKGNQEYMAVFRKHDRGAETDPDCSGPGAFSNH